MLSTEELMLLNCGVGEDSGESLWKYISFIHLMLLQRGLWRLPWTARRSNQSVLKEISPEYSLEGLMLKLQHFGHLMQIADSGKDHDAAKD